MEEFANEWKSHMCLWVTFSNLYADTHLAFKHLFKLLVDLFYLNL